MGPCPTLEDVKYDAAQAPKGAYNDPVDSLTGESMRRSKTSGKSMVEGIDSYEDNFAQGVPGDTIYPLSIIACDRGIERFQPNKFIPPCVQPTVGLQSWVSSLVPSGSYTHAHYDNYVCGQLALHLAGRKVSFRLQNIPLYLIP